MPKLNWQEADVLSRILIMTNSDLVQLQKKKFYAKTILLKLTNTGGVKGAYYYSKNDNLLYLLVNEKQYLDEAFDKLSKLGHVEFDRPIIIN